MDMELVDQGRRPYEESITSNTWRGLRLASKNRLSAFDRLEPDKEFESLFKPATTVDVAAEDHGFNATEGRDLGPQEQHQSAEEQRADEQSQVTAAE
jgi:THO complex subunit 1